MTKTFRGKKVEGWEVVESTDKDRFVADINLLMDKYDFMDFQFSTSVTPNGFHYVAAILLAPKNK